MLKNVVIKGLSSQQDLNNLKDYIREIYDVFDILYTTTNPNGNISERRGKLALFFYDPNYYLYVNIDGSTGWRGVQLTLT